MFPIEKLECVEVQYQEKVKVTFKFHYQQLSFEN